MLNAKKTRKSVGAALNAIDSYLAKRSGILFKAVLDHLRDVGEARSATELDEHFKRNFNVRRRFLRLRISGRSGASSERPPRPCSSRGEATS